MMWFLWSITVKPDTEKDRPWWTTVVAVSFYSLLVFLSRAMCVCVTTLLNISATVLKHMKVVFL